MYLAQYPCHPFCVSIYHNLWSVGTHKSFMGEESLYSFYSEEVPVNVNNSHNFVVNFTIKKNEHQRLSFSPFCDYLFDSSGYCLYRDSYLNEMSDPDPLSKFSGSAKLVGSRTIAIPYLTFLAHFPVGILMQISNLWKGDIFRCSVAKFATIPFPQIPKKPCRK